MTEAETTETAQRKEIADDLRALAARYESGEIAVLLVSAARICPDCPNYHTVLRTMLPDSSEHQHLYALGLLKRHQAAIYSSGWKGARVIPDPPVDGAIEFIGQAIIEGWDVVIHSSRARYFGGISAMRAWLKAFKPWNKR